MERDNINEWILNQINNTRRIRMDNKIRIYSNNNQGNSP